MTSAGYEGLSQEHSPDFGHASPPVINPSIIVWLLKDTGEQLRERMKRLRQTNRTDCMRGAMSRSATLYQLFRPF